MNATHKLCLVLIGLLWMTSATYAQGDTCPSTTPTPNDLIQYSNSLLLLDRSGQYRFLANPSTNEMVFHSVLQIAELQNPEIITQSVVLSPDGSKVLIDLYSPTDDARFAQVIDFFGDTEVTITTEMLANIDVVFMEWASSDTIIIHHEESSSDKVRLEITDVSTQQEASIYLEPQSTRARYRRPVLSSDNSLLAIATIRKDVARNGIFVDAVDLYDTESGRLVEFFLTESLDSIYYIDWSPTSNNLVIGEQSENNHIRVLSWQDENFDTIANIEVEWGQNIQWSSDGKYLMYMDGHYGTNAPLKIFDIDQRIELYLCSSGSAHWSPDSRYIAIFIPANEDISNEQPGIYLFEVMSGELYRAENIQLDIEEILGVVGWADISAIYD